MTTITAVATAPTQTPMEAFQEKLKAKMRDDIASLLPDDVVASMVQKVINDEFFAKKTVRTNPNSWNDHSTKELPTPFQEAVMIAAKPIIDDHVKRIIAENAERIAAQIDTTVKNGLLSMCLQQIDQTLDNIVRRQLGGVDVPALVEALRTAGVKV